MLGFVTIGQAPREDIVASMFGSTAVRAIEAGALDDLSEGEIGGLRPRDGESPLVTRLRDGSEVVIAKERVIPLVNEKIRQLEAAGCDTICVLCTGEFPPLGDSSLILYPDRLIGHVVDAILPAGTLGVLMPHEGQRDVMLAKWSTCARTAVTAVASPYSASEQIGSAIQELSERNAGLIVLDCMGFDRRMLTDARRVASVPVLLSNGVVGSVLRELTDISVVLVDQS